MDSTARKITFFSIVMMREEMYRPLPICGAAFICCFVFAIRNSLYPVSAYSDMPSDSNLNIIAFDMMNSASTHLKHVSDAFLDNESSRSKHLRDTLWTNVLSKWCQVKMLMMMIRGSYLNKVCVCRKAYGTTSSLQWEVTVRYNIISVFRKLTLHSRVSRGH